MSYRYPVHLDQLVNQYGGADCTCVGVPRRPGQPQLFAAAPSAAPHAYVIGTQVIHYHILLPLNFHLFWIVTWFIKDTSSMIELIELVVINFGYLKSTLPEHEVFIVLASSWYPPPCCIYYCSSLYYQVSTSVLLNYALHRRSYFSDRQFCRSRISLVYGETESLGQEGRVSNPSVTINSLKHLSVLARSRKG